MATAAATDVQHFAPKWPKFNWEDPLLLASHTLAEQAGEIAAAAGVKTLVLSHFVPGGDASVTDDMWQTAAAKAFDGRIIVGRDLLRLML